MSADQFASIHDTCSIYDTRGAAFATLDKASNALKSNTLQGPDLLPALYTIAAFGPKGEVETVLARAPCYLDLTLHKYRHLSGLSHSAAEDLASWAVDDLPGTEDDADPYDPAVSFAGVLTSLLAFSNGDLEKLKLSERDQLAWICQTFLMTCKGIALEREGGDSNVDRDVPPMAL